VFWLGGGGVLLWGSPGVYRGGREGFPPVLGGGAYCRYRGGGLSSGTPGASSPFNKSLGGGGGGGAGGGGGGGVGFLAWFLSGGEEERIGGGVGGFGGEGGALSLSPP